ncbi:MAG: hypothetical protein AAGH88_03330 [Planctomycetota bacterium]
MWAFVAGFLTCLFSFFIFGYVLLALEDEGYADPYCTDSDLNDQSPEETAR